MAEPPNTVDVPSKGRVRRRLVCAAIVLAGVALANLWIRRAEIDPQLVGHWEWSPDPTAGFPLRLNGDGSGDVVTTLGICAFAQSCRWSVDGDELPLYSTPQLKNVSVDGAQSYLSDLWKSVVTSQVPIRRYRIVERTGVELCLQPLSDDGSKSDGPAEVYRKAVDDQFASM